METCEYIDQNNNQIKQCNGKINGIYGSYCKKHRRNYLVNDENYIINERFTYNIKDYLLKDLSFYYIHRMKQQSMKEYKKNDYYQAVSKFIHSLERYKNINPIILLQRRIREKKKNKYEKCSNNEDFYTFDPLSEIEEKYFFFYRDLNNLYWGFDIRSLQKVIDMNGKNPYTTEVIPENIIGEVNNRLTSLKTKNEYTNIEETILKDRKESIKQKVVDLFSDIEYDGYSCQINWFYELSGRRLKELYKQLEDIWNYRAQLSNDIKKNICPPDGNIFTTPVAEVYQYNCKEDLQELILHNILKFKNAISPSDKKLGYMFFLIGLSTVSQDCYLTHADWVAYI